MNASAFAQSAYGLSRPSAKSPRETEYQIFARVTRALVEARDSGDIQKTAHALYDNSRLWNALAADVAQDDNALPDQLRVQILSLTQFSLLHANRIMMGQGDFDVLIDVNESIMKGLRGAQVDAA